MIDAHICDKICYLAIALLHYRLEWCVKIQHLHIVLVKLDLCPPNSPYLPQPCWLLDKDDHTGMCIQTSAALINWNGGWFMCDPVLDGTLSARKDFEHVFAQTVVISNTLSHNGRACIWMFCATGLLKIFNIKKCWYVLNNFCRVVWQRSLDDVTDFISAMCADCVGWNLLWSTETKGVAKIKWGILFRVSRHIGDTNIICWRRHSMHSALLT